MAVLSTTDRQRLWRGLMRYWSATLSALPGCTKTDILAAVSAADDWIETNAASYNTALPALFRSNATLGQKAFLLACVALARGNITLLRSILGEVD